MELRVRLTQHWELHAFQISFGLVLWEGLGFILRTLSPINVNMVLHQVILVLYQKEQLLHFSASIKCGTPAQFVSALDPLTLRATQRVVQNLADASNNSKVKGLP